MPGVDELADHAGDIKRQEDRGDRFAFVLRSFQALFLLGCIGFPLVMQSDNRKSFALALQTLDQILSIFFAVLVFECLDRAAHGAGMLPESYVVTGSFGYTMLLQAVGAGLSHLLTGSPSTMAIFAASGAYFVGSGFAPAAASALVYVTAETWYVVAAFFAIVAIVGLSYVVVYRVKMFMGLHEDEDLMQKSDDLETATGAVCVSMSWTILVQYVLIKELQAVEGAGPAAHAGSYTLLFTIGVSLAGGLAMFSLSGLQQSASYVTKRFANFVASATAMSIACSWLLCGKAYFSGHAWDGELVLGRVAFAACASFAAVAAVALLAALPGGAASCRGKQLSLLIVALLAGWSWEDAFGAGVEFLAHGRSTDAAQHLMTYRFCAALALILCGIPVYLTHFKPIVLSALRDKDEICNYSPP